MINLRIQELRKDLNLTQKQFGDLLNLSQNQISSIESGYRAVTERVLCDICDKFNTNPNWLKDGELPMFNDFTKDLNVSSEAKELSKLYTKLDPSEQKIIKDMINALLNHSPEQ